MIEKRILDLAEYARVTGLIEGADWRYTVNRLLELFGLDEIGEETQASYAPDFADQTQAQEALEGILKDMLDYAAEQKLMPEDTITYRDLFDTKIMGCLVARPSEVQDRFWELYRQESPQAATDYYYKLSCDSDYIRRYRIKKDMKWTARLISPSISPSRRKTPRRSRRPRPQSRADIPNACCAKRTRGMRGGLTIRPDRTIASSR